MTVGIGTLEAPFFIPVEEGDALAETPGFDGQLVRIPGIRDPIEGSVIHDLLQEEGIPNVIESSVDSSLGRAFVFQQSWGSVLLRLCDVEQAWALISQMREGITLVKDEIPPELTEGEDIP